MKIILLITITKGIGGSERRFARLADFMIKKGYYDLKIILQARSKKDMGEIDKFKATYLKDIEEKRIVISKNSFDTLKILKLERPEVFHMMDWGIKHLPIFLTVNKYVKNFTISLNSYFDVYGKFEEGGKKYFYRKTYFRIIASKIKKIDCLYPAGKKVLIENIKKMGIKKIPDITCPENSFIDLKKFYPEKKENIIVYAARLEKYKNPGLFVEAINKAKETLRESKYKVFLCGIGGEYTKLEELIKQYAIQDILEMPGHIDISTILKKSKLFFSLQTIENYPSQSLMEAVASGNYIIASNVGETDRIVKPEFGILVNLNADELAEAVKKSITLLENEKQYSNVIEIEKKFASENFVIENFVEYMKEFWDEFQYN